MRKIIRFSIYLFISFTFILGIAYLFTIGNRNIEEEKIIKNENINTISYYANKYDLLNENNKIINIKETILFSMDGVYYYSNNSKQDKLSIDLTIDKNKSNIELEFDIISDKLDYSDFYTLEVVLIGDEIYIVSRYDYVLLPNIDINKQETQFSAVSVLMQKLFCKDLATLDGGSSTTGSVLGYVLVPALMAAGYAIVEGTEQIVENVEVINSTPTQSSTSTTTNVSNKEEELNNRILKSLADDLLHEEKNDYGWTGDELLDELKNACKKVVNGALVGMGINEIMNTMRPVIPLGLYTLNENPIISYTTLAKAQDNAIIYSMEDEAWNKLSKKHTEDGMFVLNKYFLDFWISRDCYFLLLTNPNYFYIHPNIINKESTLGKSYRKELMHIYSRGYRWECSLSSDNLCNSWILAD